MKLYAALLFPFLLTAAPLQAQYNLSVDEMMDLRDSGVPILDPKLEILINDVYLANFRAVEFHNNKFIPKARKYMPMDDTWLVQHASLVARWTAWDLDYPWWFNKKKIEASSSVALSGGVKKVRNVETMKVQNLTLLRWRSVLLQVGYIDENKRLLVGMDDLGDLWSEFLARVDRLEKAINALRKY